MKGMCGKGSGEGTVEGKCGAVVEEARIWVPEGLGSSLDCSNRG